MNIISSRFFRQTVCMAALAALMPFSPTSARTAVPSAAVPTVPSDTMRYAVNPAATLQEFEGWGVSLCWWANVAGHWSEDQVDELVDWLVSPKGLNYRIFRYNIGGGDDPLHRHCTPHHMGKGKGLRAEMEGFKDNHDGPYIWERDSAQRRIMLKIREKRPDAIFEAFSNSAPYYMTFSGCCAGHADASKDNLRPECYEEFAHYLVDVCRHYKEEYGIEFRTLDPFNEPFTSYWGADGGQEGCHFDVESQIRFLRVLHPILQASGLSTRISASDETSVAQSVLDFKAYAKDSALDLVGQWNVHTYTATNEAREAISRLCQEQGKHLWMSEVGAGGKGICGNLRLAQTLIDDIRHIRPNAWVDWQYMEGNDQWCLVRGDVSRITGGRQGAERIKNYYVRQQFSRFIPEGYTFLSALNDQTLAARNADGSRLVIVSINPTDRSVCLQADLTAYAKASRMKEAYVTSETDNLAPAPASAYSLKGKRLTYHMQPLSVVTFVVKTRM